MNGIYEEIRLALHGIWQHRWMALGVAWAVAALGWLVIALIPNSYQSRSRIYVEQQNVLSTEIGVSDREQRGNIEQIRQTLAATENLEQVVRRTDLASEAATPEQIRSLATQLKGRVTVAAEQDPARMGEPGNMFEVSVSWNSPGLAREINQSLIDVFVERNLAGSREQSTQSVEFLDGQIAEREGRLRQMEERRAEFEGQFAGLLPGTGTISQRIDQARSEYRNIESDLAAAQSSLSSVQAQISGTSPTVELPGTYVPAGAGAAGPNTARLNGLEAQLADARGRGWTDAHPDVQALNNQIGRARAAARGEGSGGTAGRTVGGGSSANPLYMSLRSMLADRQAAVAALVARRDQLRRGMEMLNQREASDPSALAEQQQLDRNYQALQTQYNDLVADRERMRLRGDVAAATDTGTYRVVDPPSAPTAPISPNRPLLLALVLIAAIGAGIAAAFAKSQLKTTYATARRLGSGTGLPVLGAITEIVNATESAFRRQKTRRFAMGSVALAGVFGLLLAVEFIQRGMAA